MLAVEQLLNKLIEKGWKPFGWEYYDRFIIESNWDMCFWWKYPWTDWKSAFDYNYDYFNIREIVSIDSGLWQFVCKNKLLKHWVYTGAKWQRRKKYDNYWNTDIQVYKPEYRIIESALCKEDKLEQFILDNIKVDG